MEHMVCDVLVIGSGGAGLRAAIEARARGLEVCVVSKGPPGMGTCTIMSGGCLYGAIEGVTREEHRRVTLAAGRGLNQPDLVAALVADAPAHLAQLRGWGLRARIDPGWLYAEGQAPAWGRGLTRCLVAKARESGARLLGNLAVWGLTVRDGAGAVLAHSAARGKWLAIGARAVVLACGGAGALFSRHDNPQRITGDGYALALSAGADLQDLEFMQFYPLVLAEPGLPAGIIAPFLADKGVLRNARGENILEKYGITERPAGDLARDLLSQALFREIALDGGEVWMDVTGVSEAGWKEEQFSATTWENLGVRVGARSRPVRISPAAHTMMGGVRIDEQGRTTVSGLFAGGEVTAGVHGANRLGGNGLTDMMVFGARAGASAAEWAARGRGEGHGALARAVFPKPPETGPANAAGGRALRARLQRVLWERGGIIRTREGLESAIGEVAEISREAAALSFGPSARDIQNAIELRHGARTAELILRSALAREESRGCHFRDDFPKQDDGRWLGHVRVRCGAGGRPVFIFEKV